MRRLTVFILAAVVLSVAAIATQLTRSKYLARGWYRIPTGTVYLSDGKGSVCGYSSWQHYTGAGGTSGGWESLEELPRNLENRGPCPVREDRADWLPRGRVHVLGPTPPLWSDGRGHVCYTSRLEGPDVAVKALPDGVTIDGLCTGERLPKAMFKTADGKFYDSDGDGHVCEMLHAASRQPQPLWKLPEDTLVEGPCPNRTEPPLTEGWHRIPSGTVYLANGIGDVCGYASWAQFVEAGGRAGTWSDIAALPIGTNDRGVCEPPPIYQQGWQLIGGRLEPVFVDAKKQLCGATWQQFFAAGGDVRKLTQRMNDPRIRWLEKCAIELPKELERPGWLAAGWFRVPSGGIYLSDGRGHVCSYASWPQYQGTPTRGSQTSWTQLDGLPTGLIDDGVCEYIEVENQ